jgi:hypothetical protein
MPYFKNIFYLPEDVNVKNLIGLERYNPENLEVDYQLVKTFPCIHKLYEKFVKEFKDKDIENLTTEVKPWIGFYLYSLVKDNNFHKILQIGVRHAIDSLYLSLGLQQNEISEDLKEFIMVHSEKKWIEKRNTIKNIPECKNVNINVINEESYIAMPEMIESGKMFDMIVIRGIHLFDNILVDFFYADKLLYKNGILVIFDPTFDSAKKLAKYIQTNFANYKIFPMNLGSQYCYTFVKMREDDRAWNFHIHF